MCVLLRNARVEGGKGGGWVRSFVFETDEDGKFWGQRDLYQTL